MLLWQANEPNEQTPHAFDSSLPSGQSFTPLHSSETLATLYVFVPSSHVLVDTENSYGEY